MKIKTKIITCLFVVGSIISGFSQSKGIIKRAEEITTKMNADLTGESKEYALTENQTSKIIELQVTRMEAMKKIREEGGSDEEKKTANKNCYQKIYSDILTKEQRLAMKEANKKTKH